MLREETGPMGKMFFDQFYTQGHSEKVVLMRENIKIDLTAIQLMV
jgi:hypothetical protein